MGHNLLNETINENHNYKPSEILYELNDKILNTLKQNSTKTSAKYGMDITLISIDKKMKNLEYAGAHNPLLIFRSGECIQIKANQRSIGSYKKEEDPGFTNNVFQLMKGDMLYMFSDGYADQIGGKENKRMFSQPFREILQSICRLEMPEQKKTLDETAANWRGNQNQTDDILVVGIRI
jgi:serine phosphatase RsbU (regulator of sigma subunit)